MGAKRLASKGGPFVKPSWTSEVHLIWLNSASYLLNLKTTNGDNTCFFGLPEWMGWALNPSSLFTT